MEELETDSEQEEKEQEGGQVVELGKLGDGRKLTMTLPITAADDGGGETKLTLPKREQHGSGAGGFLGATGRWEDPPTPGYLGILIIHSVCAHP